MINMKMHFMVQEFFNISLLIDQNNLTNYKTDECLCRKVIHSSEITVEEKKTMIKEIFILSSFFFLLDINIFL